MRLRLLLVLLLIPAILVACTPRRRGGGVGGDDDDSTGDDDAADDDAADDDAGDDDAGDDDIDTPDDPALATHRGEAWGNVVWGGATGSCDGEALLWVDADSGLADGLIRCFGDGFECSLTFSGGRYPEQADVPARVTCDGELLVEVLQGFSIWQDGPMLGGTLQWFDEFELLMGFGASPVAP